MKIIEDDEWEHVKGLKNHETIYLKNGSLTKKFCYVFKVHTAMSDDEPFGIIIDEEVLNASD